MGRCGFNNPFNITLYCKGLDVIYSVPLSIIPLTLAGSSTSTEFTSKTSPLIGEYTSEAACTQAKERATELLRYYYYLHSMPGMVSVLWATQENGYYPYLDRLHHPKSLALLHFGSSFWELDIDDIAQLALHTCKDVNPCQWSPLRMKIRNTNRTNQSHSSAHFSLPEQNRKCQRSQHHHPS